MYYVFGKKWEFNVFVLDKIYFGFYDEIICIDWMDDFRCFVVGSKDMFIWVFGVECWDNFIYYVLGGYKDVIVVCFFEFNSLDLYLFS